MQYRQYNLLKRCITDNELDLKFPCMGSKSIEFTSICMYMVFTFILFTGFTYSLAPSLHVLMS